MHHCTHCRYPIPEGEGSAKISEGIMRNGKKSGIPFVDAEHEVPLYFHLKCVWIYFLPREHANVYDETYESIKKSVLDDVQEEMREEILDEVAEYIKMSCPDCRQERTDIDRDLPPHLAELEGAELDRDFEEWRYRQRAGVAR